MTPVNLSDYEELWVAVEWEEKPHGPGVYFAWLDTLSGPHVPQKGDFIYLNHQWSELFTAGAEYDGNWGIGAIIEGLGPELSIGNIKGPVGITANLSNIGGITAVSVTWSIAVNGGLLNKVTILETKSLSSLAVGSSIKINTGRFLGFGIIHILIIVKAENANEVSETKSALLLGPFVLRIQ